LTIVKVCGITSLKDAVMACRYGADLIGFVFAAASPRRVTVDEVKAILGAMPDGLKGKVGITGLFLDEKIETVAEAVISCALDNVQLSGQEKPASCEELKRRVSAIRGRRVNIIKTFKIAADIMPHGPYVMDDYAEADYFLFDTFKPGVPGGTGKVFDWEVVARNKGSIKKPFFVAGGLKAGNVGEAIRITGPYGVDVSSGIEKNAGEKDPELLKEFVANAKNTKTAGQ